MWLLLFYPASTASSCSFCGHYWKRIYFLCKNCLNNKMSYATDSGLAFYFPQCLAALSASLLAEEDFGNWDWPENLGVGWHRFNFPAAGRVTISVQNGTVYLYSPPLPRSFNNDSKNNSPRKEFQPENSLWAVSWRKCVPQRPDCGLVDIKPQGHTCPRKGKGKPSPSLWLWV